MHMQRKLLMLIMYFIGGSLILSACSDYDESFNEHELTTIRPTLHLDDAMVQTAVGILQISRNLRILPISPNLKVMVVKHAKKSWWNKLWKM